MQCSQSRDVALWNEWREANRYAEIWLQRAHIGDAYLEGVNLSEAHLEGTSLLCANLKSADLGDAQLEGSLMQNASLQGANLSRANLRGISLFCANFENSNLFIANLEETTLQYTTLRGTRLHGAIVDGGTFIWNCDIDYKTDFTGVGLDNARINPELRTRLQDNIRRLSWERWYNEEESGWLEKHVARFFWSISDYGSSMKPIFGTIFQAILFFSVCYAILSCKAQNILTGILKPEAPENRIPLFWSGTWLWLLQVFYFASASMVTFGFSGINVEAKEDYPKTSMLAITLVTANLLTGYFLLACLVTRIGIMFQALSP